MLVRESLYNFKRQADPIQSSGLGKITLIKNWLDEYNIENYIINDDYSIDVKGSVNLDNKELSELPEYIQFNLIYGSFYIYDNNLVNLKGCPKKVNGWFNCSKNKLTSLEGCPTAVIGYFNCAKNKLSSLEGCPTKAGKFNCFGNYVKFTKEDVEKLCKVKGEILV